MSAAPADAFTPRGVGSSGVTLRESASDALSPRGVGSDVGTPRGDGSASAGQGAGRSGNPCPGGPSYPGAEAVVLRDAAPDALRLRGVGSDVGTPRGDGSASAGQGAGRPGNPCPGGSSYLKVKEPDRSRTRTPGRRKTPGRSRAGLALLGSVLSLALSGLLLSACVRVPQYENAAGDVADLHTVPQSLALFAERAVPDGAALRSDEQARADMLRFRERFFAPWTQPELSPEALDGALAELAREAEQRGFAENLHPWSEAAWDDLRRRADLPGLMRRSAPEPGVTVRASDLRTAPTRRPRFSQVHGAGQGWPFDLFQQSALPVGLPLAVHHRSLDGAWLFVECSVSWGWVPAQDVALAGPEFRRRWTSAPLGAFVRDGVSLLSAPGNGPGVYLATAGLGTVLPMADGAALVPLRGADGLASAVPAPVDERLFRPMPLRLDAASVARLGDGMMAQPYGWGGLYGQRDCSAMMRDLFAPFGLWLPRNSGAQARAGAVTPLEGLEPAAREQALLDKAAAFRTLIHMPGHIGLYVGEWRGRPAMFHNVWGVRRTLNDGREGRLVIGRAVISTLRPGEERADVEPGRLLVRRVDSFNILSGDDATH